MSAICRITGFLGYATADDRPAHLLVEAGQVFDDDDPLVVSRPDVFDIQPDDPGAQPDDPETQAPTTRRGPGARKGRPGGHG